ncbi:MAG: hypothetical protein WDM89_17955 [Rhizomicrobium sp.]
MPAFIFANKFVITGAREPEVLVQVIDKALEAHEQADAESASEA